PNLEHRVLSEPKPGRTVFTDASSITSTAVVVWKEEDSWKRVKITEPISSVQHLEALEVAHAISLWPEEHTNIVTDSMFVFKLLLHMTTPGWAGTAIAIMLEEALQRRCSTVSIIHVKSHENYTGYYQEGNNQADTAAKGVWTLSQAREVHNHLHIGAKALAKFCDIPLTTARDVVATCPYCQR
ncbi:POL1 protein, partial [Nyctibius grandis]|nr:POL1 protein [Nyctibius grandis]